MKKGFFTISRLVAFLLSFFLLNQSFASSFQLFTGINYSNPAMLTMIIKENQLMIGDDIIVPHIKFRGTDIVNSPPRPPFVPPIFDYLFKPVVLSGTVTSNTNYDAPYLRAAQRLNKQIVVALEVTQPFKSDVIFPAQSIIKYETTINKTHSIDFMPNIAYQLPGDWSKLSLGGGLDIMNFSAVLDAYYPSYPNPLSTPPMPFGAGEPLLSFKSASRWTLGWHAGFLYQIAQGTFLDFSYYSQTTPKIIGTTSFTGYPDSKNSFAVVRLPSTANLTLTQYFSENWNVQLTGHFTKWSRLKNVILYNVAGPLPTEVLTPNYRNTQKYTISTWYIMNKRWAFGGSYDWDETPTNNVDRTVAQPDGNHMSFSISGEYHFNNYVNVWAGWSHTYFPGHIPINHYNINSDSYSFGNAHISADTYSVALKYNA